MKQDFKVIPGYDGAYLINSDGIVISVKTDPEGVPLKWRRYGANNIPKVALVKKYQIKFTIARVDLLVAKLFVDNPHNFKYVHNISGNSSNVSAANLVYRNKPDDWTYVPEEKLEVFLTQYLEGKSYVDIVKDSGYSRNILRAAMRQYAEEQDRIEEYEDRVYLNRAKGIKGVAHDSSLPISQFSLTGDHLRDYSSLSSASRATGISLQSISKAKRSGKTAGGFRWKLQSQKKSQK